MATISVENAVQSEGSPCLFVSKKSALEIFSTVFLRWITYMTLTHKVINVGNVVGHLLRGFAEHTYSLFLELKDNITVLWKVYSLTKHRRQLGAVDVQATFSIYCHLYHRKHHK